MESHFFHSCHIANFLRRSIVTRYSITKWRETKRPQVRKDFTIPCTHNWLCIESFWHIVWLRAAGNYIDYVWIRAARLQGASSKLQSALSPAWTREDEMEEEKKIETASARMAESSSLGLSRVRAGRCTYASGKVAIKILRKRYHAACRAGTTFILTRRAQCDCVGLVRLGEHPTVTSVAFSLSLDSRSQNISARISLWCVCV